MPRLTPEQEKEFEKLAIANPDKPHTWFCKRFPLTGPGVAKRRKKYAPKTEASALSIQRKHEAEVSGSLEQRVNGDIELLRKAAIKEFRKAMISGDREMMVRWWDRWMANAKIRADMVHAMNVFIDNRTQNINLINIMPQLNEVWSKLCPECRKRLEQEFAEKPQ